MQTWTFVFVRNRKFFLNLRRQNTQIWGKPLLPGIQTSRGTFTSTQVPTGQAARITTSPGEQSSAERTVSPKRSLETPESTHLVKLRQCSKIQPISFSGAKGWRRHWIHNLWNIHKYALSTLCIHIARQSSTHRHVSWIQSSVGRAKAERGLIPNKHKIERTRNKHNSRGTMMFRNKKTTPWIRRNLYHDAQHCKLNLQVLMRQKSELGMIYSASIRIN